MPARPKRDTDSHGGQQNAKPFAEPTRGDKTAAQPAMASLRLRKQVKPQSKREHIAKTLQEGFALFGLLALEGRHKPIGAEQEPQRINPLARGREIHIAV